ncbi:MAG TPA: hypothetical protein VKN99_22375 [Polyangia bacterium]|nr:hypothetical protein [Polyangia bacterium]
MKIPGLVFYVLAAVLIGFGAWRVALSRQEGTQRKRYHLVWGVLYVLVGLWLVLTQAGLLPAPRLGR